MTQQIQIIGLSIEETKQFFKQILIECIDEIKEVSKDRHETPLNISEACKFVGVSPPTLRKFVDLSLIRRHDLGPKKKVFYLSELQDDIKRIQSLNNPRKLDSK